MSQTITAMPIIIFLILGLNSDSFKIREESSYKLEKIAPIYSNLLEELDYSQLSYEQKERLNHVIKRNRISQFEAMIKKQVHMPWIDGVERLDKKRPKWLKPIRIADYLDHMGVVQDKEVPFKWPTYRAATEKLFQELSHSVTIEQLKELLSLLKEKEIEWYKTNSHHIRTEQDKKAVDNFIQTYLK